MDNKLPPILIAKQKDAPILKDDYKLGWLYQNKKGYIWAVWGSSNNLGNALKAADDVIRKQGPRPVYVSETPLERAKAIREPLPELTEMRPG